MERWQSLPAEGRARFIFRAAGSHTDASWGITLPFSVKRIRTGQSHRPDVLRETPERACSLDGTSHARFNWTLTQRSRIRVPVHQTNGAYPKTCPTAIPSDCAFMLTLDKWDSARFTSLFLTSGIYSPQAESTPAHLRVRTPLVRQAKLGVSCRVKVSAE
ncbi:MAG TPA: hypothetical protein VLA72_03870 [Anaerolineales bacterium]|nr:hypothetical protein [Anaerolineales bacterium]